MFYTEIFFTRIVCYWNQNVQSKSFQIKDYDLPVTKRSSTPFGDSVLFHYCFLLRQASFFVLSVASRFVV